MKKFDKKVWIFILVASFLIPGYFHTRNGMAGETYTLLFFFFSVFFTFLVTLAITFVNMVLIGRYFDKVLPWTNQPRKINKRLLLELTITSTTAAIIIALIAFSLERLFPQMSHGISTGQLYFDYITSAIMVNLLAMSIIEGNSIYTMWKESLLHSEILKRENIEKQFAVLKNQVNPHFLFNSLNVLSSLVVQAPSKAQEFIMEFSKVYRYIFDVGDETVIEVTRELDFIYSFISLHQKRHSSHLKLTVNVSAENLSRFIPVLSLQILVENAIKHNEISEEYPLYIEIFDDGDNLVVRNNYQPRTDRQESLGIGLQNLKERYGFLSEKVPIFIRKDNFYIASLPILTID